MQALTRKDTLGKNLNNLRALFPEAFDFFPRTWLMPSETRKFKEDVKQMEAQLKT
jgi:tubulin polyglutamylase TTLL6/13